MIDQFPDGANFFSSLYAPLSQQEIAGLYRSLNWTIRKCSLTDYEIFCSFAELIIESEKPILMHGSVMSVLGNAEKILTPLRVAEVRYFGECYGENTKLLQEFQWGFD